MMNPKIKKELMKMGIDPNNSTFKHMTMDELQLTLKAVEEMLIQGDSGIYKQLNYEHYKETPVTFKQFIEDNYYLGGVGKSLYYKWKEELTYILDENPSIILWLIRGAIGIGKSTAANVAMAYKLYRVLCMRNPFNYYDLMGDGITTIAFGLFNITKKLAFDVNYKQFGAMLKTSPWFESVLQETRTENWVSLGDEVSIVLGSRAIHALGQAVIGGLMDETDFTTSVEYQESFKTFKTIHSRITSRFRDYIYFDNPTLLTLISSMVVDEDSFMAQMEEFAGKFPNTTHISSFPEWEVKPIPKELDTGYFHVYFGDDLIQSKIVDNLEELKKYEPDRVIKIPNLYRTDFELDIDEALRDKAGVSTGKKKNLYLRRMDLFHKCCDPKIIHPFSQNSIVCTIDNNISLVDFFKEKNFFRYYAEYDNKVLPIKNPLRERYIHVDLAKNEDAVGIGCVHFDKFIVRKMLSTDYTKQQYYKMPSFAMDFCLQVTADNKSEIDFDKIRELIFYLISAGMIIGGISYDSWNSVDSLQSFKKAGVVDEKRIITLSVDKSSEPYGFFKSIILDQRFSGYNHPVLKKELEKAEKDPISKKVDHPPKGSKDVLDSIVASTFHCSKYYPVVQIDPGSNIGPMIDQHDFGQSENNSTVNKIKSNKSGKNKYPKI